MIVLNLTGVVVSIWDTVDSFQKENYGEATGYAIVTIGSAMLLAQACYFFASGLGAVSAGSSWTVLGGVVFGIASLVVLGVGITISLIFGKPRFQLLLEGCFWGAGNEHLL